MEWLSSLGTLIKPLVTESGGDDDTLRYLVGVLIAALTGSVGVIHRLYQANQSDDRAAIAALKEEAKANADELAALRKENAEQKERLYLYSLLAPDIVTQVRIMLQTISPSPPTPSNDSTALPFPYERSRRTRPRRPRIGGQP